MEKGLLLIERFIIESLSKKDMNIQELAIQTKLDHGLLLNILPNLMMRNDEIPTTNVGQHCITVSGSRAEPFRFV